MAILDELLVVLGLDGDGLEKDAERSAKDIAKGLGTVAAGAAGIAVGAAFMIGMDAAMDITTVTSRLADQLDLTAPEAERAGDLAGAVYAAGFGGGLEEVGEAIHGVASGISDLGDLTDSEVEQMAKGALMLADRFQFDVARSTQAAGAAIKAGLVDDGVAAMDMLTAAAQRLPPAMAEELPDTLIEYGEFFGKMGATGEQTFGLLVAAAENPLYQIDKLADAVKEFTLRMADTDAVSEPLEELGLDVEHIQNLINTGKGTRAFDEVVIALHELEDQTEKTALIMDVMGGPGEDAETALLALGAAGGFAGVELEGFAGAAGDAVANMESDPARQLDSAYRTLQMTLGTALVPVLTAAAGLVSENKGLIEFAVPVVLALAAALSVMAIAQWAMNSALLASPITWIVLALVALTAGIVYLATQTTFFQDIWSGAMDAAGAAWDWLWNLLQNGFKLLTNIFMNFTGPGLIIKHFDRIKSGVGGAIGWVQDKVGSGIDWVDRKFGDLSKLPGKVVGWMTGVGGKIVTPFRDGFRSGINWIIDKWNDLSFTIPSVNIPGIGKIGGATISTPNVPRLAEGGIVPAVPGGMLALLGEGGEREVVAPLSEMDRMLHSVARAVAGSGSAAQEVRVVLDVQGGDRAFIDFLKDITRTAGGGSIVRLADN